VKNVVKELFLSQGICYNIFMKLICDYKNKRFAPESFDDKNAEICVEMLNYSVSVPQVINLSFEEVALELKDRQVHFVTSEDNDLTSTVQSAVNNMFKKLGSARIHCVVMLLAGERDLTFEKTNEALKDIPQKLPNVIIFFGIKIDESFTGKNKVFLIVSE